MKTLTTGIKIKYKLVARPSGDGEAVYADNTLAVKELNWQCIHSLEDMMLSAWNWEKAIAEKP